MSKKRCTFRFNIIEFAFYLLNMANKRKRDDKLEINNNKKKPSDLTSSEESSEDYSEDSSEYSWETVSEDSSEDSSEDVIDLTGGHIEINQPARSRKNVNNTIERKQALADLTNKKANAKNPMPMDRIIQSVG